MIPEKIPNNFNSFSMNENVWPKKKTNKPKNKQTKLKQNKRERKKETQAHKDTYRWLKKYNFLAICAFSFIVGITICSLGPHSQWVSNIYLSEIIISSDFHSVLSIVLVLFVTFSISMNCSCKWSETKPTNKNKEFNIRHSVPVGNERILE